MKPCCIIDSRAPQAAIERLAQDFYVLPFRTQGITYEAISCHPDIFMFQENNALIVAPNIPSEYKDFFQKNTIAYREGSTKIDETLQNSVAYNCVATPDFLFHKTAYTAPEIVQHCHTKTFVHLPQAYTRCSMFALNCNAIITSDKGIAKTLEQQNFELCYVSPREINLLPYSHGFIGGCMGVFERSVYIIGSLNHCADGEKLRQFIQKKGYEIVELYNGKLYDGGGIFFFSNKNNN